MSDYHILRANEQKTKFSVVMHHEVPTGDNSAGQAFALCLVEDKSIANETILPPAHLDAAEITRIENGEIYEHIVEFGCVDGLTDIEIRDLIDASFTTRSAEIEKQIRDRYVYWGFGRDIA